MNTRTRNTYRRLRKQGWRAQEALSHAKNDLRLEDIEDDGLIRFRWEWDDNVDTSWLDQDGFEEDKKKWESGYWEAMGCVAEVPSRTVRPFADVDSWEVSDSLWGIVGPFDQSDKDYRRSVEIDLAYESGVLK